MLLTQINIFRLITIRNISTTAQCLSQTSIKQIKVMKKIMAGREKGRRRWVYNENMPKMESASKLSSTLKQGKEANRRVTILNKLFMKNVTDLMATGMFAEKLYGYGLQISTVKVADDFKKMNIYWIATNMENDGEIERILKSVAGPLRHELSVLRLMGEVPQINFVKDRSHMKSAEIDAILKHADFGEDFIPTDATLFLKNEYKLEMKLPDHLKEKIRDLDHVDDGIIEELPQMRHDTFGLDHAKIMNKINVSLSKSMQAWSMYENSGKTESSQMDVTVSKQSAIDEIERLTKEAEMRENFVKYLESKNVEKKFTPERKKHRNFFKDDQSNEQFDEYTDPIPDSDFIVEDDDYRKK
ncbi:uncharacterized protein [Chironomus tepperi]|uniref:uncharacterized protein n=1 Tax=Chironomus tepperi TaxID=113505 RepID=UPI00391F097C